jgi:glycosyltransferase involved in cell wall biosynthesis
MQRTKTTQHHIVWMHDLDHRQHSFICLAAETLAAAGHRVTVWDQATGVREANYQHLALKRDFSQRSRILILVGGLLYVLLQRPDVIVVSLPRIALFAWLIARLTGARFVYYAFELYGEQTQPAFFLWRWIERMMVQYWIDGMITQNEPRAHIYRHERKARVEPMLVHNYYPLRSIPPAGHLRRLLDLPDTCRIVLYEGALIPGRHLEQLLHAVEFFPENTFLVIIGPRWSWWRHEIKPTLTNLPFAMNIIVMPPMPRATLLDCIGDADVGVIIYGDQVRNNYYCAPSKLSDYMQANVPVLAPNFPTIAPIIEQYQIGEVFATAEPHDIAQAVQRILARPRHEWDAALAHARQSLTWESQHHALLEAVLGSPAPTTTPV